VKKSAEAGSSSLHDFPNDLGTRRYERLNTGRDLLNLGVTPLEDMIAETAIVKLMWVAAQTKSADRFET